MAIAALVLSAAATTTFAAEPSSEPILRIDPGEHTAMITRIATDEAGRWLVTASYDKTARVWDLRDGRLVMTLRIPMGSGHEGKLFAVALSPDGATVAVAGWTQAGYQGAGNHNIYLFERATGRLLRRLPNMPNVIQNLAFSPNGRWLSATLGGKNGVRLFAAASGQLLAEDLDYGGSSLSAHFGTDGRLITAANDGLLRLYRFDGERLTLMAKRAAPGGKQPVIVRFSPDGRSVAVGFEDSTAINVLEGDSLALRFAPDTTEGNNALGSIAWSRDGAALFAAGLATRSGQRYIRRWTKGGMGVVSDWPVAGNTIMDLLPLPDRRLAFASAEPTWGVLDEIGQKVIFHASVVADLRDSLENLKLSQDGVQVGFRYEWGKSPAIFDSLRRIFLPTETPNLAAPLFSAPGVTVTDWKNSTAPRLNGSPLKLQMYEFAQSMALWSNGEGFVLGTEWFLRAYARDGTPRWGKSAPGAVWGVNVSGDGRWVVAAYGDGTIRWHRATDGVEQLAFYPHPDKKRWIMWSPEGYYDASPGGEDLIGWHLNQGKDKEARFISNSQLYDVFYRPDIVQAKFRGDEISGLITLTAAEALKNPPPILTFTRVPSTSTSNKESICYKATSTGGGIGEVRLFQNGKLIKSDGYYREAVARNSDQKMQLASLDSTAIQRGLRTLNVAQKTPSLSTSSTKGNEFNECQELETMPGENEISVAAFNAPNTIQSAMTTARFTSERKPEKPHLYVLGIGIDKYRDPSVSLQYAAKDANDFRTMMQKEASSLYKPQNIHVEGLYDKAATKEGIQKAIQALSDKVKPWDSFILFVASHGVLLENQYHIVTAGFNGSINAADLISSNEIVGMSTNIKSLSQLFIFDTCHAGGVDNIVSGLYDARMSIMAKKMGLHIYASAGSVQEALDGFEGNGLFTHALLKSMEDGRKTDANKDNQVSVVELGQRARQETLDISETLGHPQTPYIINFGRDNALFRVQ
jgi:WD40 repeat protein